MKKLTLLIACFFLTSITHAAKSAPEEKQNVKYRKIISLMLMIDREGMREYCAILIFMLINF